MASLAPYQWDMDTCQAGVLPIHLTMLVVADHVAVDSSRAMMEDSSSYWIRANYAFEPPSPLAVGLVGVG